MTMTTRGCHSFGTVEAGKQLDRLYSLQKGGDSDGVYFRDGRFHDIAHVLCHRDVQQLGSHWRNRRGSVVRHRAGAVGRAVGQHIAARFLAAKCNILSMFIPPAFRRYFCFPGGSNA